MLFVMTRTTVIEQSVESQFVEIEKSLQHTELAKSVNHSPSLWLQSCLMVSRMVIYFQKEWVDLMLRWTSLDLVSVPESVLSQLVVKEKKSCQMDLVKGVMSLLWFQVMVDNVRCQTVNSMRELKWMELVLNVNPTPKSQVIDWHAKYHNAKNVKLSLSPVPVNTVHHFKFQMTCRLNVLNQYAENVKKSQPLEDVKNV